MSEVGVYTTAEVVALLRISERTLRQRVRDGVIPTVELGGRAVRFPKAVIDRLCSEGAA